MSDQTPSDHTPQDAAQQERVIPEGWSEAAGTTPPPPVDTSARVAFCQDCGKPLTADTLRAVGTGVFCEPCLMARVAAQNGVPSYGPVSAAGYPVSPMTTQSHPVLAGFLGVIPGVGAMYNGQYAKGFAHLVIFVLLDSISKNVSSVFGAFVFAWVCYQIFDAYHTAKARNEGLPLPNVFGLNDIGEKMGFTRHWGAPGQGPRPAAGTPPSPPPGWQTPPAAATPIPSGADWVGYVPPTNFANAGAPRAEAYVAAAAAATSQQAEVHDAATEQAYRNAGFIPPAHTQTFTGNPYAVPPVAPEWAAAHQPVTPEILVGRKRFPVGAFWLIGLGVLILLANLVPDWKVTERWWPPVLFAGLSALIFTRRLRSGAPLLTILRTTIVLMLLAIMFALHAADIYVNFGILFAVLFITVGLLLVLERTIGVSHPYIAADAPRASFVQAQDYTGSVQPVPDRVDDATKGGLS